MLSRLPQSLRLINEGPLVGVSEELPVRPEPLGDLGVVHLGVLLRDLPTLDPGPDHESVHRPLDVLLLLLAG